MTSSRSIYRRLVCALIGATLTLQSISCGTFLYPERIGQRGGPLDYKVVALDTAGCLLFVVPGVIAFCVDIYNGTIYLPPEASRCQSPDSIPPEQWISHQLDPSIDTPEKLQAYLQSETGQSIELRDEDVSIFRLENAPTSVPVRSPEESDRIAHSQFDWKQFFSFGHSTKKTK
jgi:hypothetical protein